MPFPEPGGPISEMFVAIEIFELGFKVMPVERQRRVSVLLMTLVNIVVWSSALLFPSCFSFTWCVVEY